MPVSAVMSPMKQCTRPGSFRRCRPKAIPTAMGRIPPTIADEITRYSGKHSEIERPARISARTFSGGTPLSKHW